MDVLFRFPLCALINVIQLFHIQGKLIPRIFEAKLGSGATTQRRTCEWAVVLYLYIFIVSINAYLFHFYAYLAQYHYCDINCDKCCYMVMILLSWHSYVLVYMFILLHPVLVLAPGPGPVLHVYVYIRTVRSPWIQVQVPVLLGRLHQAIRLVCDVLLHQSSRDRSTRAY